MNFFKKNILSIPLGLLFITNTYAQNDDVYCEKSEDKNIAVMCKIAKNINIPVIKVAAAQAIASIEATAIHCSFKLTNDYINAKQKMIADSEFKKAFDLLFESAKLNPPSNLTTHCPNAYNMVGPSIKSKNGWNGSSETQFYK